LQIVAEEFSDYIRRNRNPETFGLDLIEINI
jgi:hypothetical protein